MIRAAIRAISGESPPTSGGTLSSTDTESTFSRDSPTASTNPTSVSIAASAAPSEVELSKEPKENGDGEIRRSARSRGSIATYSDTILSGHAVHTRKSFRDPNDYALAAASRAISGATLVNDTVTTPKRKMALSAGKGQEESDSPDTPRAASTGRVLRRKSTRVEKIASTASSAINAVASASSVLGKRSRDALDSAKSKIQSLGRSASVRTRKHAADAEESPLKKRLRISNPAESTSDSEDSDDSEEDEEPPPPKKQRKIWVSQGLYVGQIREDQPRQKSNKRKSEAESTEERKYLPLPMFHGSKLIELGRDFKLPFDILNPLSRNEAPKDWKNLTRNRFVGDAEKSWKKSDHAAVTRCQCTEQSPCEDATTCLNRSSIYECNENNCGLWPKQCENRGFAELKWRKMNKNAQRKPEKKEANLYGDGIEVMRTGARGHGVRAMRSFRPGQIIIEYNGEIITPEEADRRMNEDYKGKEHFYMMEFHHSLIIDATRGSICRFVNHSCDPNCRIEKWIVDGEPRMALFAEKVILSGDELTYDYNFTPFSKKNIQKCLCGAAKCRGFLGPKNSGENKVQSAASKIISGTKRKLKQALGINSDKSPQKRRKTLPTKNSSPQKPQTLVRRQSEPAVKPISRVQIQMQLQSRADRANRRSSSTTLKSRSGRSIRSRKSVTEFRVTASPKASSAKPTSQPKRRSQPASNNRVKKIQSAASHVIRTGKAVAATASKNAAVAKYMKERTKTARRSLLGLPAPKKSASRTTLLAGSRTSLTTSNRVSLTTSEESQSDWDVPASPIAAAASPLESPFRHSGRAPKPSPKALENSLVHIKRKSRVSGASASSSPFSSISARKMGGAKKTAATAGGQPSRKSSAKAVIINNTTPAPPSSNASPVSTPAGRMSKRMSKPSPKMREIQLQASSSSSSSSSAPAKGSKRDGTQASRWRLGGRL